MRNLAVYIVTLFLAGCSVYKSELPELPVPFPDTFLESHGRADITDPGRFWEKYNDPVLNKLVTMALDGNLNIKQAIAREKQFSALFHISRSSRLPFLNLTGSAGADDPLNGPDGTNIRLSAVAGYEIDLWNRLKSSRDAASLNREASIADLKTAYISVAAQVTELYYLIVEQRAQLVLSDKIIESQSETLNRMENRYEEGLVQALDVYQAKQNILAAKAAKPQYQANLDKASHALAILLGQFPRSGLGGGEAVIPLPDNVIDAGIPASMVARRPDIEAALFRLKAKDAEVASAVADRFPALKLTGVLGTGRLDYTTVISDTFWSLLLEIVQPVFDNGRRKAESDRRKAIVEEELAKYHQTVLKAFQEVEDALSSYRSGLEQLSLLQERHEATSATLRLAEDQYFEGLTEYLSVLTAQVNHFNLQRQLLNSRRQLISEQISLFRALGGDWVVDEINNNLQSNGEIQ